MRSLLYLYDPLCGWCYAATSGIARLRAAGVTVSLRPTGLFSDPGRVMTPEFADYAWKNDQRIAAMTGQIFTEAYRRQVLQAPGTAFDSTNAVLALTAVAIDEPEREADALRAVQEARYVAGRDITDAATLEQNPPALNHPRRSSRAKSRDALRGHASLDFARDERRGLSQPKSALSAILTEAGFPSAAAEFDNRPAALLSANATRVAAGQAMMREVGGSGVSTLVLVDGESSRLLDSKVLYGPAEGLLALFKPTPARS